MTADNFGTHTRARGGSMSRGGLVHRPASMITAFLTLAMTDSATSAENTTITLAKQGSFFVAVRIVQGKGAFDRAKDTGNSNEGTTFWAGSAYVQYQIPATPR